MGELYTYEQVMQAVAMSSVQGVAEVSTLAGAWQYGVTVGDRTVWLSAETGVAALVSTADWATVQAGSDMMTGENSHARQDVGAAMVDEVSERAHWIADGGREFHTTEEIADVLDEILSATPAICADCYDGHADGTCEERDCAVMGKAWKHAPTDVRVCTYCATVGTEYIQHAAR